VAALCCKHRQHHKLTLFPEMEMVMSGTLFAEPSYPG
jgi:hypothetical protein